MKERINRLARGMVDSRIPELVLQPQKVEAAVPSGEKKCGELMVISGNNLHIKGLIYSDNERVTIENNAFGGLRNRIIYEVNSEYMEDGEEIRGSFYLVTNGGEREIPYSLRVHTGVHEENLGMLKTARDFAMLAKRDRELALRMFEYQDFVKAPFMQEARVRTIYEGLKGRKGRENLLEEFLVALGVKEPVHVSVDTTARTYESGKGEMEGVIDLALSGWGHIAIDLKADGAFLSLDTLNLTDRDFSDRRCQVRYHILPELLHGGKNLGRIFIRTLRQEFTIDVEAIKTEKPVRTGREERLMDKQSLKRYLDLRLDYEIGAYEPALLLNQMRKKAQVLRAEYPADNRVRLLEAEIFLLSGYTDNASAVLEEIKESILQERDTYPQRLCYYQYLVLCLHPDKSGQEALLQSVKKCLWEKGSESPYLFLLLMKADPTMEQNPLKLYRSMEHLFRNGVHSPFVYAAACRLFEAHPDLLSKLGEFEIQVLHLGADRELLSEATAVRTAGLLMESKYYRNLMARLAKKLYKLYPRPELLEAVCSLLIKGEQKDKEAFSWYEKALKNHISLTRLYEYFLYSLPENYGHLLPREVLLYFFYDKGLDVRSRCVLYYNILRYMNPSQELYQSYLRHMEQFAMEQLFSGRIDSRLAVIYENVIYRDMIDGRVAKVLPGILNACRIVCEDPRMKYVIVRYEELQDEEAYLLENGEAYVPVCSSHMVLLFQDVYGNRYLDVRHRKMQVMGRKELLDCCYEACPDHPILKLRACSQVMEKEIQNADEALLLEETIEQLNLNPVFERKILRAVTRYYCQLAEEEGGEHVPYGCSYLIQMDKDFLEEAERVRICETFISQNYMTEACEMIKRYGSRKIRTDLLLKLCDRMIVQQLFDEDRTLLHLAYEVFEAGQADSVILDYLCEHFNGSCSQMYEILIQGVGVQVDTYDLEERLLGQMLFTGCCEQIDSVFELYMKRKTPKEDVVRAYFTEKSLQYFLEEKDVDEKVFDYLRTVVNVSEDKSRVPTIYLLALTKYFSGKEQISDEDKTLCRKMLPVLLQAELVFPYTRELSRHIPVPEEILDKTMVEYRGNKEHVPRIRYRILPEEEEFRNEEMKRVYQGIFVKEMVLFEGETMEYEICESTEEGKKIKKTGKIACDHKLKERENSRFACLNRMGAALEQENEGQLAEAMEDYLKKTAVLSRLFPLE